MKKYPNSEYVEDSKFKIQVTQDQLAGKEMSIGRFYLNRHNYTAAINRFRNVLQYYQTTRHAQEALYRLVEAYLGLGITDEAQTAAAVLGPQLPRQPMVPGRLCAPEGQGAVAAGKSGLLDLEDLPHGRSVLSGGSAMLARLSIRDVVLIDQLDLEFSRRPDDPHRRDRRGQIDPARRAVAGAGRARRRRPCPPRPGPGPGDRRFRAAAGPRCPCAARRPGHRDRRRTDPAAGATRRRTHPRLCQRPERQRAGPARRSPPRWSRFTASTTSAR